MKVLVLAARGLQTAYLGCYGNPWIATPNLDALAASGVVFDQHFAGRDEREQFGFRFHIQFGSVLVRFGKISRGRSVVIHKLNIGGTAFRPAKANAPLLIHADAVLSLAAAFEGFEPVNLARS